jgi:hypothetical protein
MYTSVSLSDNRKLFKLYFNMSCTYSSMKNLLKLGKSNLLIIIIRKPFFFPATQGYLLHVFDANLSIFNKKISLHMPASTYFCKFRTKRILKWARSKNNRFHLTISYVRTRFAFTINTYMSHHYLRLNFILSYFTKF